MPFPVSTESAWIDLEAGDGRKLEVVVFTTGERLRDVIRWVSGEYQEIIVGPRADGQTCLLFVRPVADEMLRVIEALGE